MPPTQSGGTGETMNDLRQKPGNRRMSRRIVRGAMTVGMTSVVLMAFGATAAEAAPAPANPPAPTAVITTLTNGHVQVTVTGSWSWLVGSTKGDIQNNGKACGNDYG